MSAVISAATCRPISRTSQVNGAGAMRLAAPARAPSRPGGRSGRRCVPCQVAFRQAPIQRIAQLARWSRRPGSGRCARSRSTFSSSMLRGISLTQPCGLMVTTTGSVSQAKTMPGMPSLPACASMLVGSESRDAERALGHRVARRRRDHDRVVVVVVQQAHRHGARGLVADHPEALAQVLQMDAVDLQHLLACPRQQQVHIRQPAGKRERLFEQVAGAGDHPGEARRPGSAGVSRLPTSNARMSAHRPGAGPDTARGCATISPTALATAARRMAAQRPLD